MRKYYIFVFLSLLFIAIGSIFADEVNDYQSFVSLNVSPGIDLPIGTSSLYFMPGLDTGITAYFTPETLSPFIFSGSFKFVRNVRDEEQDLLKFALMAGAGVNYTLFPWLSINGLFEAGYSFCAMDTDAEQVYAGIPVVALTAGPSFNILPSLSLNLNASFHWYIGLSTSIAFTAGVTYHIQDKPDNQGPSILKGMPPKLINLEFDTIFPVFYKYYDDHPAGSAILLNPREDEVTDITLDLFVKQYMDTPKRCTVPDSMVSGETCDIDINVFFNDSVLEITEGTKVAAELTLSYRVDGVKYSDVFSHTIRMQYRNAMTWDDDRRAAAFVTAKDPAIMGFSKNVASMLQDHESSSINKNLQKGMALHNALSLYGLTYVVDPNTSYSELSTQSTAIDYLQFPRETLEYRAGDCDDLSILNSALLESLGIKSAFVTVPGHIFIAFSLGISQEEAIRTLYCCDNLIFAEGEAWVPLEITSLKESFMKAWEIGARQWRDNDSKGLAGFFPIRSAWQQYEPVGLPGSNSAITIPLRQDVINAFHSELSSFISSELEPQLELINSEIQKNRGAAKYLNKLGVLYARYGFYDEAVAEFNKAIEAEDYIASMLNIGNIYFLEKEMDQALEIYSRGYSLSPDNSRFLLCLARTNHALGNSEDAMEYYSRLKEKAPELALKFAYIEGNVESSDRAANVNNSADLVVWEDED